MIYLRPMGGLCNRMRAIDGFLTYHNAKERPLTIIWINNNKLNCSFDDLFEPIVRDNLRFLVLNPVTNFRDRVTVKLLNVAERTISPVLRSYLLGIALGKPKIKATRVNPEWAGIYNSIEFAATQTMRETEAVFHNNTRQFLENLLNNNPVYTSSCYRLFQSDDRYGKFIPVKDIKDRVSEITSRFSNTFGLHIRYVNHPYASKYSTVEKFEKAIGDQLKNDPSSTFFLATDSGKVKEYLISKFGPDIILVNPSDAYRRSDKEAIKQAVIDLYCLSETKKIFGSLYSSFTLTAADIGDIPEVVVQ